MLLPEKCKVFLAEKFVGAFLIGHKTIVNTSIRFIKITFLIHANLETLFYLMFTVETFTLPFIFRVVSNCLAEA